MNATDAKLSADKGTLRAGLITAKSGLDYAASYLRTNGHDLAARHMVGYVQDAQRALDETEWPETAV